MFAGRFRRFKTTIEAVRVERLVIELGLNRDGMRESIDDVSRHEQAKASGFRLDILGAAVLAIATLASGLSACGGEDVFVPHAECSNGAEQDISCGAFGEQTQRCVRYQWENVGECRQNCPAGDTRAEACGFNLRGEETHICGDNTWKALPESCLDVDACVDGSESSEPCGLNARGRRPLLCEDGEWELQECDDLDVCLDDEIDVEACGSSGNSFHERSCIDGQWDDEWSSCEIEIDACVPGDVELTECGFKNLGVLRRDCRQGRWSSTFECEMRGKHVAINDTHLFLIAEDDSLWVAGSTAQSLSGRAVSSSEEASLREPFDARFYVTSEDRFAVSGAHACAIEADEVYCWGDNSQGQLGVGVSLASSRTPVRVPGVGDSANPAVQVVVTENVSCAMMLDGDVRCWGWNGNTGGVGAGKQAKVSAPVRPKGFLESVPPAERLFARAQIVCAQTHSGDIYCWGDNTRKPKPFPTCALPGFDCRPNDPPTILEPTKIGEIERTGARVTDLHIYRYNSCAHYTDGAVVCWGRNDNGERGDGSKDRGNGLSLAIESISPWALSLHSSTHRRCARMSDETLHCWGLQSVGDENARMLPYLGEKLRSPQVATRFVAEAPIESLSMSATSACAVHADAVVRCTGFSPTGSFGRGEKPISQGAAKPVLCPAE